MLQWIYGGEINLVGQTRSPGSPTRHALAPPVANPAVLPVQRHKGTLKMNPILIGCRTGTGGCVTLTLIDVTLNYNTVSYIISYYHSFMSQSFKLC